MPVYDDDELSSFDEPRHARRDGHEESWDFEEPDARDVVPDDLATVRCSHCRKYIFEDALRCPYCKNLQLEVRADKKPLWYLAAVIFCILVLGGFSFLNFLGMLPWHLK